MERILEVKLMIFVEVSKKSGSVKTLEKEKDLWVKASIVSKLIGNLVVHVRDGFKSKFRPSLQISLM